MTTAPKDPSALRSVAIVTAIGLGLMLSFATLSLIGAYISRNHRVRTVYEGEEARVLGPPSERADGGWAAEPRSVR